jgi:para-nitrobenzyl esterase
VSRANWWIAAREAMRLAAPVFLLAGAAPAFAQLLHTKVAQGALAGKTEGAVAAYLGVPFAAPPVGDNRWRPPGKPTNWKGERKASRFSASCQQAVTPDGFGPWTAEYVISNEVSEDCLYLNVWTPAKTASEKLPVLFWIYGGGFSSGGTSVAVYNGAHLASKGIIVVSANYRVGVYGFLAHPELTAESAARASGNYGLLDMVAALQWVHDNIAQFGGDPKRVTIAGQSAGAASVHHLISSPLAKGLFSQAIAQSGSGMGLAVPSRASAEATGKALSGEGGSALTLAQLRKLSTAELDARVGKPGVRFSPIVDGLFIPNENTVGANTNDTPILTGMTANEGTGLNSNYNNVTTSSFNAQLNQVYGKFAKEFAVLYPAGDDKQAWASSDALSRERGLASMYFWARERLPHTMYPTYAYLWTHIEPGPESARYLAFHSSEIPYVFGTLDAAKRPFTDIDRKLSDELGAYWVNFVKTGNPNGGGLPKWPMLTTTDRQILELGDTTRPRVVLEEDRLALFEHFVRDGGRLGLF